jgi:hypothetical protein
MDWRNTLASGVWYCYGLRGELGAGLERISSLDIFCRHFQKWNGKVLDFMDHLFFKIFPDLQHIVILLWAAQSSSLTHKNS